MQRFGSMVIGCGLLAGVAVSARADTVLYNSGGFEAAAGYSDGPPPGFGQALVGQPAGASDPWTGVVVGSGSGASATVISTFAPAANTNQQQVQLLAQSQPQDTGTFYFPTTFTTTPHTAAANESIAIRWTMTATMSANDPFFGIVASDGDNEIARFGIDGSTGQAVGSPREGFLSGFTAASNTPYQYELLLDYGQQKYSVFAIPADGVTQFTTPFAGGNFETATMNFTDADIATFGLSANTALAYTGAANFDNYSIVSSVPEPASVGLVGLALGVLARRRSRVA